MDVSCIVVPYDSGHRDFRMGRGPRAMVDAGLPERISAAGHDVSVETVEWEGGPASEIATGFGLCRQVAERVRTAKQSEAFPIILTGNCLMQVGVIAGLGGVGALVWFDAHGDLNTPETSASGFLDGMALAIAAGWCWRPLTSALEGFRPVEASGIALLGARDLDPGEAQAIEEHDILHLPPRSVAEGVGTLEDMLDDGDVVSAHLDLDALDPEVCAVNELQAPDGMSAAEVDDVFRRVAGPATIGALTLSAYDPGVDPDGRTPAVAGDIVLSLMDMMVGPSS